MDHPNDERRGKVDELLEQASVSRKKYEEGEKSDFDRKLLSGFRALEESLEKLSRKRSASGPSRKDDAEKEETKPKRKLSEDSNGKQKKRKRKKRSSAERKTSTKDQKVEATKSNADKKLLEKEKETCSKIGSVTKSESQRKETPNILQNDETPSAEALLKWIEGTGKVSDTVRSSAETDVDTEIARIFKRSVQLDTSDLNPDRCTCNFSGKNLDAIVTNGANHKTDQMSSAPAVTRKVYFSYFGNQTDNGVDSDETEKDELLCKAKQLKHGADHEADDVAQCMQYFEAAVMFLLTGSAMEQDGCTEKGSFTMFKDTLNLIKFIITKVQKTAMSSSPSPDVRPSLLTVLSLRCQSLIHQKLYNMRKQEIKESTKAVSEYLAKPSNGSKTVDVSHSVVGNGGQPTASQPASRTSSPASSTESQSSSLSSGEFPAPSVSIPLSVYTAIQKQQQCRALMQCVDLWEQADALVYEGRHRDFFVELDQQCRPLTLHSSLKDLVRYVCAGIRKIRSL